MSEASKIIHVPRRFVTSDWGGTETVIASLAREQKDAGWQPEIHTSLALSGEREEICRDIPVRRYSYCYPFLGLSSAQILQMDRKGGNLLSFRLFWSLWRMKGVRVFHAHAIKRLGAEVATVARWQKKPFVVSLHGGVFDVPVAEQKQIVEAQTGKFEWGRLAGAFLRSRQLLDEADAVICVGYSEYVKAKEVLGHGRVYHIGNGVDAGAMNSRGDGARFRQKYGFAPADFVFSCISRIDPQKDQLTLIRAFAQIARDYPQARLFLAGPCTSEDYREQMARAIRECGCAEHIRFEGQLMNQSAEQADAFCAMDAFVLASRHEPFGIVILEAWSCVKPVIASRVGGLKHLIADGQDGLFFEPGDVDGCAAQMRLMMENSSLRQTLATAGHTKAVQKYSWKEIFRQTEEVYASAASHAKQSKC